MTSTIQPLGYPYFSGRVAAQKFKVSVRLEPSEVPPAMPQSGAVDIQSSKDFGAKDGTSEMECHDKWDVNGICWNWDHME